MSSLEMTTRVEKFQLIEGLVNLEDHIILEQIKKLKQENEVAHYEASLKPMTVDELTARAKASNQDIEAGRVYDLEDVIKEEWDL